MAKKRKVMITCAVTGAIHTPSMSPHLPITPEEIADAAIGAAEAGAALVHVHARNPKNGLPDQSPGSLPAVPQGDQAALELRAQHHHRRRADDGHRGAAEAVRRPQARGRLAQHGLDELRPLPDARAPEDVQVRLGEALSRRQPRPHLQEHVHRHREHPDDVRRRTTRASRSSATTSAISIRCAISPTAASSSRRSSSSRCSASSAASARTRRTWRT